MKPSNAPRDYIPFGRPNYSDNEIEAVVRIMKSGWPGMGEETRLFELELAAYLGVPHVVAVNSCTSALFLSLLLHDIRAGDEVICPSLTWCSTANAALYLGATPVFCDIDRSSFNMTPETILAKLSPRTKAVAVVHFGGLAVDVKTLRSVLPDSVAIIEDAAHAFGTRWDDGTKVGTSGNFTCFSFYANKNLSTGEGGAIALYDETAADKLRSLRLHALPADAWQRYIAPKSLPSGVLSELGYKMNYTDLQAAIGRVQLQRIDELNNRRLAVAQHYHQGLENLGIPFAMQRDVTGDHHARHLFIIVMPDSVLKNMTRDELVIALRNRMIGAAIHYTPLHGMPLYLKSTGPVPPLENTDWFARRALTLPISSSMSISDADYVMAQLSEILGNQA